MQSRLRLENSFGVELGQFERYSIVTDNNNTGRVSLVRFQIDDPFSLSWGYINEIYIEPVYRKNGIAKTIVNSLGNELREKRQNGILINAIGIQGARKMYDHLGWKKLNFYGSYEVLLNVDVSNFCLRKVCNLVADNFIRWQASSLN